MHLRLIQGGLSDTASCERATSAPHERQGNVCPTPDDVLHEAARRIACLTLNEARRRLSGAGAATASARYLKMQIDYTAKAIIRLGTIPHDFCEDRYWPD